MDYNIYKSFNEETYYSNTNDSFLCNSSNRGSNYQNLTSIPFQGQSVSSTDYFAISQNYFQHSHDIYSHSNIDYMTQQNYQHFPNHYTCHHSDFYERQQLILNLPANNSLHEKSEDEIWLEKWLSLRKPQIKSAVELALSQVEKKLSKKKNVEIWSAKNSLKKCLDLIGKLQTARNYLKENLEKISTGEWRKKTMEIDLLKEEFTTLISQFDNVDTVECLQRALVKRTKIRMKQKKRKADHKRMLREKFEDEKRIEKEIDDWLEKQKDAVERTKMEENMKKEADLVLGEVTKKKSDARKQLSLIASLIKLRSVREKTAQQKGENTSSEDRVVFNKLSEKLTNIWENTLKSYQKEEQGLRMMLEQNAIEDTKSALLAKEKNISQEWENVFFGAKVMPTPAYWGLTAAEREIETFINVRRSWDTFLSRISNQGSKIPIGWVLPPNQATNNWTKYLERV